MAKEKLLEADGSPLGRSQGYLNEARAQKKKQLPKPRRSFFVSAQLLQRIADLEARVARLEARSIGGINSTGAAICGGSAGGPAYFGESGVPI